MREKEIIRYGFGHTSVGAILVSRGDDGLVAIIIREHAGDEALIATLQARLRRATLRHDQHGMQADVDAVAGFVERPTANIKLPLDVRGTDFQRRVWAAVLKVPFAHTTTFTAIAKAAGSPRAVRAVGSACTRNPLEFAIPCHRVMRSDGAYSGGSEWGDRRQAAIVQREVAAAPKGSRTRPHNTGEDR
jgi:AraC family transcriptional regulator of adaptative response/methylated-DNA-[protein]-cysteine methyltransferase